MQEAIKDLREMLEESLTRDELGEALQRAKEKMDQKNVYYLNPSFDR